MFCPECGQPVNASAPFCEACKSRQPVDGFLNAPLPGHHGVALAGTNATPNVRAGEVPAIVADSPAPPAQPLRSTEPTEMPAPTFADARFADSPHPLPAADGPEAAPRVSVGTPPKLSAVAGSGTPARDWQQSLPAPFNTVPVAVLAVCSLLAGAGLFLLWPTLKELPNIFDLLGASGFGGKFGLLLLSVWIIIAAFGAGCVLLAWRLGHADRVARGLTYVLCAGLAISILLGNAHQAGLTLTMIASIGVIVVLRFVPAVDEFFASGAAPQGDQPAPIVVARTLVALWAGCAVLLGVTFVPLGGLGGNFVFVGLILIALGVAALRSSGRIADGDEQARVQVSVGAGVYLLALLILGRRDPGILLPAALVAGVVWNLWIPQESQAHFANSR